MRSKILLMKANMGFRHHGDKNIVLVHNNEHLGSEWWGDKILN
jgi:hypothetical protein